VALDIAHRHEWRLNGRPAPDARRRDSLWVHQLSARWRPPGQRMDIRAGIVRDRHTRATLALSNSW